MDVHVHVKSGQKLNLQLYHGIAGQCRAVIHDL